MTTRLRGMSRRAVLVQLVCMLLVQATLTYAAWLTARTGREGWFFAAMVFWGLLTLAIHEYWQWLWPVGIVRAWLDRRSTAP